MSLYDLQIGDIETFNENQHETTDLIGYYPLYLYSKKVNLIPEVLKKSTLPPLVLSKKSPVAGLTRLMGSNMNMDSVEQHFVLDRTEMLLTVPSVCLSFHLYFDMITRNTDWSQKKGYRFSLFEFAFILQKKTDDSEEVFFRVSFFLEITDVVQTSSGNKRLHSGSLKVIAKHQVEGVDLPDKETVLGVSPIDNQTINELFNDLSNFLETSQTRGYQYFSLLSSQPFLFQVETCIA